MTAAATKFDPRAIPVRFSHLKWMAKSPAHYLNAASGTTPDTRPLRVGYATHVISLGGKLTVFDGERRGKVWDQFKALHHRERIVTISEYADAEAMANAVKAHDGAMSLIQGAKLENEIDWDIGGRKCQSHLDIDRPHIVADLKTSNTADPDRFVWQAMKMGYHAQMAMYADAKEHHDIATGSGVGSCEAFVIVVESKAPYPVTVMKLTERALEHGRRLYRLWFERLMVCEQTNHFPAYVQSVVPFDVPDDGPDLDFGDEMEVGA